ncbi:MAG TPA: response regulator transcription factor [Candidatus Baltobacteraceae bacterium]|jgi:DNA-binding NarL/FixJ family response regulator|nr:response regulator transcription factor [Candidatus Baltobacteraceae bacterium]
MMNVDTAAQLRVIIVEKELLFGRAVAHVLAADPGVKVVGVVAARDAMPAIANADVVVIDIDNENVDEVVDSIKKGPSSNVRICAMSAHTQGELMQHCLSLGVDAYIVKDSSLQELFAAIKTLGTGSSYVDPRVAASLLRRRGPSNARSTSELSARERDIIRLIAEGHSNREIGRRLILAEKTIKNHVSHIFAKIHCTARSQVAVYAVRSGLAAG